MTPLRPAALAAALVAALPLDAQDPAHASAPSVAAVERTEPIVLDGRLDEAIWSTAPAASGFVQIDPDEGEPATQRTEVRFAYDAEALWIGARMYDTEGRAGVVTRLARRDQLAESDFLQLVFDTYHDHNGRTIFTINPSGVKGDAGQASPFADPSWDPVWQAATAIDSLGWTAELRIPFSQLRFPRDSLQTWGLQVWRHVQRLNERSMWSPWRRQDQGGPQRFGHLTSIRAPQSRGRMELLPYALSRASYVEPAQPGSPFQNDRSFDLRVGADLKYQLSSTLTLDATINPDFGQVEVDPAVVNLSAFETFFQEKRPFFVEGSGLFGFGDFWCFNCSNVSSMSLFYSRRIGRAPQGTVNRSDARYVQAPENSPILGAAKITGRTSSGLQIGVLNAVTGAGRARIMDTLGGRFTQEVEPLSNYFVGRMKRTYRGGNTTVGLIGTSVTRRFDGDVLRDRLPGHAESVGADWEMWWRNRTYHLLGNVAVSNVAGDPDAILRLQRSSARYFQRPDRGGGSNAIFSDALDPDATSLRGFGGYLRMAKDAGDWRWETAVNLRSPGFEVNDAAFLTRADYVWTLGNVLRSWTRPTALYRDWAVIAGGQQQVNFDGDLTDRQLHFFAGGQLANYWNTAFYVQVRPEVGDDGLTRGGPVVRRPRDFFANFRLSTDARRSIVLATQPTLSGDASGGRGYGLNLDVRVKPAPNLQASVGPAYNYGRSTRQFILRRDDATATHFHGQRAVFARLEQHRVSMNTRLNWTFTPTLTLELFAQPFLFAGDYSGFREFTGPRTTAMRAYGRDFGSICHDAGARRYTLDPNGDCADPATRSAQAFSFGDPDLNLRSLRGNAVLRWEYRPGSTLFLVWQQQRAGSEPFGDFDLARDAGGIFDQRADNVFVIKASYWIGR